MKRRFLAAVLALAVTAACLTACSEDSSLTAQSSQSASSKEENSSASELPKGADSKYELYKTVMNYLKNGYNLDDLKDVYDIPLTIVVEAKEEKDDERNFTLGMNWEESRTLIAKLVKIADDTRSEMPREDDGRPDHEKIDYSPYKEAFPESMQQKIKDNDREFTGFIYENIIDYTDSKEYQGLNHSKQSYADAKWETMPEDKLRIDEYDRQSKDDYKDLRDNFPQIYEVDNIGEIETGRSTYSLGYYYTSVNGKYYFIRFQDTVGGPKDAG